MFMFLLTINIIYALEQCDSPIEPLDIPCMVVTTWEYPLPCSSYSVEIYDSTPTLLDKRNLGDYGNTNRCNITFNYSQRGSYLLNFSSGDSATIIVEGVKMELFRLYVFVFFFGLSLVFVYFMHKYREDAVGSSVAYGSFAAALMVIMGGMIVSGFDVIITDITFIFDLNYYLAAICFVLALYTTIHSAQLYKRTKPKEEEFSPR